MTGFGPAVTALLAAGWIFPAGDDSATIADKDKAEAVPILQTFAQMATSLWPQPVPPRLCEVGLAVQTVKTERVRSIY